MARINFSIGKHMLGMTEMVLVLQLPLLLLLALVFLSVKETHQQAFDVLRCKQWTADDAVLRAVE
jgi:hypothetical protein